MNGKEYEQVRKMVSNANPKHLQTLLGFKTTKSHADSVESRSLKSELLLSTPKAYTLLNQLHCNLSVGTEERHGSTNEECTLSVDEILRALLMIDPVFETPWNALATFASALHNNSVSDTSLLQCVSSIEEFLLKTQFSFSSVTGCPGVKSVPKWIRATMIRFVENLTQHLYSTPEVVDDSNSTQLHYEIKTPVGSKLLMDLLRTTFTVCKTWNSELINDMVLVIHFRQPASPRTKDWLQIVRLSLPILSHAQIEQVGTILLNQICDCSNDFPFVQELPIIIKMVIEIASLVTPTASIVNTKGSSKDASKLWRRIAFIALYQTATRNDEQCYQKSEEYLKESLKTCDIDFLKIWVSEILDASAQSTTAFSEYKVPTWFSLYLLSFFTEVSRDEEWFSKVGIITKCNPDGPKVHVNLLPQHECHLLLSSFMENESNSLVGEEIDKIFYRDKGVFFLLDNGAKTVKWLSKCGSLIMKCLHFNGHDRAMAKMKEKHNLALPRARRLIGMVDHIIMRCSNDQLLRASIFAIAVKTVAYFEVPELRISIEGKLEHDVSKLSRLQNSQFSTLRIILGSALKRKDDNDMSYRLIEIIDRSLPFHHTTYIDRILTLPLSQDDILNISKKLLAPLYSSWGGFNYEVESTEQAFDPETRQGIIGGLHGLLELIRSDHWGTTESFAWEILSGMIVNNAPPLPSDNLLWLFQTLAIWVTDGMLHSKTVNRILRASTMRMSLFFVEYQVEPKEIVNARQIKETTCLHRLITILVRNLATVNGYDESRHILLAEGRELFLRGLLSCKKSKFVPKQAHRDIPNQDYSIESKEHDSFVLCWFAFLEINFCLLHNTMSENFNTESYNFRENSAVNRETPLRKLFCRINEINNRDLKDEVDTSLNSGSFAWLNTQKMNDFDFRSNISVEPAMKLPFLDLLLEFLFLVPLPAREMHDFDDPLLWKVISATGILMNRKQASSKTMQCILSNETIDKTAEPFLLTSSRLVRDAIHNDSSLSVLEDLLVTVVLYCQALHFTLEATDFPGCVKLIGHLWNLYQAVASEKACVKIIKYLESHVSKRSNFSEQLDNRPFSLSSIYTESDIDEKVQELRFFCLQPFLSCMSVLSDTDDINTTPTGTLVGGILGALVTDLQAGLNGKSGGIPRKLYILYCKAIEECGSLLFHQRYPSLEKSIFLLFRDVTSMLANILTTIPLRDATLFRTTFLLAVAMFPSMSRDLIRKSLCSSDSSPEIVATMLRANSVSFNDVLEDCIEILVRWASLREPYLIPWLDIAGPEHSDIKTNTTLSGMNHHETSEDDYWKQEDDERIPRFVHVPSPTRNYHKCNSPSRRPKKIPRRIRLQTKELWSWALSCSLLGLEQKWRESERTIQALDTAENCDRSRIFSNEWRQFFSARKIELQNSLLQITRFFSTSQSLQRHDQRGSQVILDMMAMNLPSAPRLRLCALIECVSGVLIHSIECFSSFLSVDIENKTRDISTFESVCCLSAWLSLEEDPEQDFSVGLFKWLAIVSRKRPPDESTSANICNKAELFGRVSMVSQQVHKLYMALKDLRKLLLNCSNKEESQFTRELIRSFSDREDAANDIRRCTTSKLHSLEKVIPREFQVESFPDFPSSREVNVDSELLGRKRSRSTKMQTPTTSRKKKGGNMNRNKVVDIFMNLDKGTSSPRRNTTKDAYADLEDFLVEG